MKKYNTSIFIFRRSFRLKDNIGLINSLKLSKFVIPIFILTPEQLINNTFKSDNCVQFMMESLEDLNQRLEKKDSRLFFFFGKPSDVIDIILHDNVFGKDIESVFVNKDYSPYSKKRDHDIRTLCKKYDIDFNVYEDLLLNPVKSILTGSDTVYKKFTPYFNIAKKKKINNVQKNLYRNYFNYKHKLKKEYRGNIHRFYKKNDKIAIHGGRKNGLVILRNIKKFKQYNEKRNTLNINTTRLSAYIKFGCVSIREVYHAFKNELGSKNDLIKQLYWRDFYYNVSYEFPRVFKKGQNMKKKYDKIKWKNNISHFNKWKLGKTGFPIVDAAMAEMNETGFMHNRGRLIVSNFLIKILGINWEKGEKYFAQTLVDYDICVNNGNWGWSAGSHADSQPYFRIFNPILQGKKHDPDCEYIKKWIPELKNVENEDIHNWKDAHEKYKHIKYPKPIVNYKKNKEKILKMYKQALYGK